MAEPIDVKVSGALTVTGSAASPNANPNKFTDLSQAEKIVVAVLTGVPTALVAIGTATGDFPTFLRNESVLAATFGVLIVLAAISLALGVFLTSFKAYGFGISAALVTAAIIIGAAAVGFADEYRGIPTVSTLNMGSGGGLEVKVTDNGLHQSDELDVLIERDQTSVAYQTSGADNKGNVAVDVTVPGPLPSSSALTGGYSVTAWVAKSNASTTTPPSPVPSVVPTPSPPSCEGASGSSSQKAVCAVVPYAVAPSPKPS